MISPNSEKTKKSYSQKDEDNEFDAKKSAKTKKSKNSEKINLTKRAGKSAKTNPQTLKSGQIANKSGQATQNEVIEIYDLDDELEVKFEPKVESKQSIGLLQRAKQQ